jgi:hypothetical protein
MYIIMRNLTTMGIIDEELNNDNIKYQMDKTDFRLVPLLVLGYGNNKITSTLKIPLRTIQRRTIEYCYLKW